MFLMKVFTFLIRSALSLVVPYLINLLPGYVKLSLSREQASFKNGLSSGLEMCKPRACN